MTTAASPVPDHFLADREAGERSSDRDAAWDRFAAAGIPGRKVEAWRNLDLRPLAETPYRRVEGPGFTGPELTDLAVEKDDRGLEEANPFVALQRALGAPGRVLRITAGGVHTVRHAAPASDDPAAWYPRLHVEVAPGVEATLVEEHAAEGTGDRFVCPVTTVVVGENATFTHLRLQREPEDVRHVANLGVRVGRDARYRSLSVALGAGLSRLDLRVRLEGPGAETRLDGLYALSNRQVGDHHTFVDHAVPHTASRQRYKGLLGGKARGVFHGRILIRPGAAPVTADQANDNLLLSDEALVNTNPELEIFADDVACRHGATIGRLDADRLFYLRARGIPKREAEGILVRGFLAEVLDVVADETLREKIRDAAAGRFFRS